MDLMKKIIIATLSFFLINLGAIASLLADRNVIVSIPKCGTHLLMKTLETLNPLLKNHLTPPALCLINDSTLKALFSRETFISSHAIYVEHNIQRLQRKDLKLFFIYRDPRDQIISTAFMIKAYPKSWPIYSKLDITTLINELIVGGGPIWGAKFGSKQTWRDLHGIAQFYELYLPWQLEHNVYTTSFEKLVGPLGGGSKTEQLQEIRAIAQHMGQKITHDEAKNFASKLFGSTATFREGKIGSWKKYFTPHHKETFKKIAGQLLINLGYEKDLNW